MLLQEQLQDLTRFGPQIQSFTIPVDYQDLVFLATSTDTGFLAARITPLYLTSGGDVPGDSIDIALNEYAYLGCTEAPLKIRVDCPTWLGNINLKIWRGLPDDPRPEAHEHSNKSVIDYFTEVENKLYYKSQVIPDHAHNNVSTLQKISESEGQLYFDDAPVANHQHSNLAVLNLLQDVDGKLYYNYDPIFPNLNLHEHDNLGILSRISSIDGQLLFNGQPIQSNMAEIITAINVQTSLLTAQLNVIQESINDLPANSPPHEINFTLLNIIPTYQTFASNGWTIEPQNLQALYDDDQSTASNLFQPSGPSWQYGEVVLLPGVSIPNYTKIEFKLGIRNTNNAKSLFELAAFNISLSSYINIWSYSENASSSQDLIVNVVNIIPFQWDKLRFRLWDVGQWHPQARFYDLKCYQVT